MCAVALLACFLRVDLPLQYDRAAISAGQWWRLVTGHWAHWSADHLFWDAMAFGVFGAIAERRGRTTFVLCVFASAAAISAGVWLFRPDLQFYRGLSGIDAGLFAMVAIGLGIDAKAGGCWKAFALAAAAVVAFALKTVWELATGSTLFVAATAAGFESLPLAHALGAAVGVAVGLCGFKREAR